MLPSVASWGGREEDNPDPELCGAPRQGTHHTRSLAARPRDGFSPTQVIPRRASTRVLWRGHHRGSRCAEAPLPRARVLPRGRGALAYCLHPVKCPGTSAIGLLCYLGSEVARSRGSYSHTLRETASSQERAGRPESRIRLRSSPLSRAAT